MSRNVLLINAKAVKDRTALHGNVDDALLLPSIRTAQDMFLMPALGSAFMKRLQDAIEAGSGTGALTTEETALLNDYITDCLVYYTMADFVVSANYQTYAKGTITRNGEGFQSASMRDLTIMRDEYRERAEFYKARLIVFIRRDDNKTAFATYYDSTSNTDSITPDTSAYTSTVWLGDDRSHRDRFGDCCCN